MTTVSPLPGAQNPWEHPLTDGTPPPVSERLLRALEAHIVAEADDAVCLTHLADSNGDGAVRVLLDLIVDDAHRHRALLERMVKRLRDELDFTDTANALSVPGPNAFDRAEESLTKLRTLIRNEQEGARYLRHLARQDAELYAGFFAVLLETFARDAEEHVHLLRYLLRHMEAA